MHHLHSQPNPIPCPNFPISKVLFTHFPMAGRLYGVLYSPLTWVLKRHHWNPCWRLLSSKHWSRRAIHMHPGMLSGWDLWDDSLHCFFQIPLICSSRLWDPFTAVSDDHSDDHNQDYCRDNLSNPNCRDSRLRHIHKAHISGLDFNWRIFFWYSFFTHCDRAGSGYHS